MHDLQLNFLRLSILHFLLCYQKFVPGAERLPEGVQLHSGGWNTDWLSDADLIVTNPGILLAVAMGAQPARVETAAVAIILPLDLQVVAAQLSRFWPDGQLHIADLEQLLPGQRRHAVRTGAIVAQPEIVKLAAVAVVPVQLQGLGPDCDRYRPVIDLVVSIARNLEARRAVVHIAVLSPGCRNDSPSTAILGLGVERRMARNRPVIGRRRQSEPASGSAAVRLEFLAEQCRQGPLLRENLEAGHIGHKDGQPERCQKMAAVEPPGGQQQ